MMMIPGERIPLNEWQNVEITIISDKVKILLNNEVIVDNWSDDELLSQSGTIAMGVNFSVAKFSNISLTAWFPAFTPNTEKKNEEEGFGDATAESMDGAEAAEAAGADPTNVDADINLSKEQVAD